MLKGGATVGGRGVAGKGRRCQNGERDPCCEGVAEGGDVQVSLIVS